MWRHDSVLKCVCVCVYIVTGVFSNHVAVATLDIPGLRFDDSRPQSQYHPHLLAWYQGDDFAKKNISRRLLLPSL